MINVRFDVIERAFSSKHDKFLYKSSMPQAPSPGELIYIMGDPYHVYSRGWLIDSDDQNRVFCFIRLTSYAEESS